MNKNLGRLLGIIPFIGLIAFTVACGFSLLTGGTDGWQQLLLANGLLYLVGIQGFIYASGHMFFADPVAESIGWPKGSPFQWEVGLANLSYGVLGVFASGRDSDWALATVVAFSIFYLGAAVGHVKDIIAKKNYASGNAGGVLVVDVLIPVLLIVFYLLASGAA